jgi:hypothetical protein
MESMDFQLEDTLDNISTLVGIKTQEKKLELLFNIDSSVPTTLVGGPLRLGQILINFSNNVGINGEALTIHDHPDLQRSDLIEMHIALGEGNGDAGPTEFAVHGLVQFVQHGYPVVDAVDKDP